VNQVLLSVLLLFAGVLVFCTEGGFLQDLAAHHLPLIKRDRIKKFFFALFHKITPMAAGSQQEYFSHSVKIPVAITFPI
jgi:hypothetical protein